MKRTIVVFLLMIASGIVKPLEGADKTGWKTRPINLRLPGGARAVSISTPEKGDRIRAMSFFESSQTTTTTVWPYPRLPIDGFSPLVAITLTNYAATTGDNFAHLVTPQLIGTSLKPPTASNYTIGILDSGSVVDLLTYCDRNSLGITAQWLTDNTIGVGGVSGTIEAPISYPMGVFANGLGAIQPNGQLDTNQLVGHGNVATVVLPPEPCEGGNVPSVIGNDFVGFFTTSIRVDQPRQITFGVETYAGPDVQILPLGSSSAPIYPHKIRMNVSGVGGVTTSAYYPDILDFIDPEKPWFPTLLAAANGAIPFGGAFYAQIGVLQGPPSPTNLLQTMRVMVDTGAQSSIMTSGMAANLSLPIEPDFTIDVLGIGGMTTDVPGYFVDYVKISALGGALEFSHVPFVMIDVASPDGEEMDGILGMNFFYNRNIVFDPALQTDGALWVSNPVLSYGDFDRDRDVDGDDLAIFVSCATGPAIPQPDVTCLLPDADGDGDVDQADFGSFQRCYSGAGIPSILNCEN